MPKKLALTDEQEDLMINLFKTVPPDIGSARRRPKNSIKPIIAKLREAGVTLCEDSIRRRAARLGLIEPVGAKYVPTIQAKRWKRPCMRCKDTKSRPVNQYMCDKCRRLVYDY
jgi:transcription initiation factor IIE alpha subunit